jgi:hypothetical protein
MTSAASTSMPRYDRARHLLRARLDEQVLAFGLAEGDALTIRPGCGK